MVSSIGRLFLGFSSMGSACKQACKLGMGTGLTGLFYERIWNHPLVAHCREISLEQKYREECFKKVDVNEPVNFRKFHAPNERGVEAVRVHLDLAKEGFLVSTGTERSFFDLVLWATSEGKTKCKGLIIRDIDPQAIAYANMVVMMVRVAKDVKDFEMLSGPDRGTKPLSSKEVEKKCKELRERLIQARDIPPETKMFYLEHLDQFAPIYFRTNNLWRKSGGDSAAHKFWVDRKEKNKRLSGTASSYANSFRGVQYQKDPQLFQALKKFADAGNIICTVGSITDLRKFSDEKVAVLDVSNVGDYIKVSEEHDTPHTPRVVWNTPESPFQQTNYHSYQHSDRDKITAEEKEEMDRIIRDLCDAKVIASPYLIRSALKYMQGGVDTRPFGYYPEHLEALRKYAAKYLVYDKKYGAFSLGSGFYRESVEQSPLPARFEAAVARKCEQDIECWQAFVRAMASRTVHTPDTFDRRL